VPLAAKISRIVPQTRCADSLWMEQNSGGKKIAVEIFRAL
jgi:hypothetical protein